MPRYTAFYALLVDTTPPKPPRFTSLVSGATEHAPPPANDPLLLQRQMLTIAGEAEPLSRVELSLARGNRTGQSHVVHAQAGWDGRFTFDQVKLSEGAWRLSARATDAAGNKSQVSQPVSIEFRRGHPARVESLRFLGAPKPSQGGRLVVELKGQDASPGIADSAVVRVASAVTDPSGFDLELTETGVATGTFLGAFWLSERTDALTSELAALKQGELVTVAEPGGKRISVAYSDHTPPTTPVIQSPSHPSLCQDTFEGHTEDWRRRDGPFGAALEVAGDGANRVLVFHCEASDMRSHLGATARASPYSLKEFPVMAFDYLLRSRPDRWGTQLDLLARLQVALPGWRGVKLTDLMPYFPRIGKVFGAVADDKWHHAEFDLLSMVRKAHPGTSDCVVDELAFMNLDDAGFMRREYGAPGGPYEAYRIDNFRIFRYSDKPDVTFVFGATDENGIAGFSCSLDHEPNTQPDEAVDEVEPLTEKDRESVKVRLGGERESD
ncbi:MAG: hypothetical protein FJ278_20370, partial [Planctomycetes bacterium]|nr:hypothetical protein [Planctomycetota bacterium]